MTAGTHFGRGRDVPRRDTWTRRELLMMAGAGAGALALGACSGITLAGTSQLGPVTTLVLDAGQVRLDLEGTPVETWGYNGTVPGPEIRLREGETLRVPLRNGLSDPTTVHWHGISLVNAMDGAPFLTQAPVEPGAGFDYEFVVPEAGTHWYHAHVGHQLDRGLYGALIVEPRHEELSYDREYTLLLDDWRDGLDDRPESSTGHGDHDATVSPALPDDPRERVSFGGRFYPLTLVNTRPPADPFTLDVRRGERIRLRVINAAADTGFRFAIGGHRLTVTHTDGMPVQHVAVDAIRIGMGERYDVLLDADAPGAWQVGVMPEGRTGYGRAILRYLDAAGSTAPPPDLHPTELDGRLLTYDDLVNTGKQETPAAGSPDRTFALTLSGTDILADGLDPTEPFLVDSGEWVRFTLRNESMKWHPMHLHGHHFRVSTAGGNGPIKDTAAVPARGGELTFDWRADNPGAWMFHCHNHYHMEDGMMRTVTYRA